MEKHRRFDYRPGDMIFADGGKAYFAADIAKDLAREAAAPAAKPPVPELPSLTHVIEAADLAIEACRKIREWQRAERIKKITSAWYWA